MEIKTLILFVFLSLGLNSIAQSYDYVAAELLAIRIEDGRELSSAQYSQGVDLVVAGCTEVMKQGETLFEQSVRGSDWDAFHADFEDIELDYDACWIIFEKIKENESKLSWSERTKFRKFMREYDSWYKDFCRRQADRFIDCPYKN